ncbi:hypothetical protein HPB52_007918 [Rhipicephalus sanguineus]|uniref:Uncharacterized protein n=1 Tax=Rhipicephalus sanguineus TaxID=34632 RepID=A0A9D4QHF2_RHISA|nr:hypothetical protein HPB52_007918 [Rhipicephalus sanguineus]
MLPYGRTATWPQRHNKHHRQSAYHEWRRIIDKTTDFIWDQVRPSLPPKRKKVPTQEGKVLVLGDVTVPEECKRLLVKGPKYATAPLLTPVDNVVHSREIGAKVVDEFRARCVTECVDVVARTGEPKR